MENLPNKLNVLGLELNVLQGAVFWEKKILRRCRKCCRLASTSPHIDIHTEYNWKSCQHPSTPPPFHYSPNKHSCESNIIWFRNENVPSQTQIYTLNVYHKWMHAYDTCIEHEIPVQKHQNAYSKKLANRGSKWKREREEDRETERQKEGENQKSEQILHKSNDPNRRSTAF